MIKKLHESDIRLLNVFRMVVKSGGFTAAQIALNASQSSISTQMGNLEARIGKRLCERGRRGFRLTEEGQYVYEAYEQLHAGMRDFVNEVDEKFKLLSGELAIGIIDNTATNPESKMPQVLANFHKIAPEVDIKIDVGGINDLENKTMNGTLLLSVGFFPDRVTSLEYELLFTEEHTLYCGGQHPLFSIPEKQLTLDDILSADYVSRGPSEGSKYLVPKFPFHTAAESLNMEGALLLLLSGRYIGYLPTHYAKHWESRGELRPLLPDRTSQSGSFHLITRKGVAMLEIARVFIEELRSAHATSDS